ncbi:hypothetical protein LMG8286_01785 [Campylobacter suis]|uniref:DUF2314 domain-containing protein n=1 Tax=Campylobacter suis TaxID=2790657 RepID=A0ABN7KBN2_9BACT|nr:hypothetical protein LMG8286_01785 [Campylobacter suis]
MIDGKERGEHMWVSEIDFDGEFITGVLINDPTNVKQGGSVRVLINEISD